MKNKCPFFLIKSAWGIYGGKIAVLVREDFLNFLQPNISKVVSTWLAGENIELVIQWGFCRRATFSVVWAGGERGQTLMGIWSQGANIEFIIIRHVCESRFSCNLCYSWNLCNPCCSVAQSCLALCKPMDCHMPGFSVLCHLPELAQTHVHWVNDAIQPSRPLLSPSPPTFNLSQHQGLFQWVDCLYQVAKVLALQLQHQPFHEYSGLFPLGLTGLISLMSEELSKIFASSTVWTYQFFGLQPFYSSSHTCTLLLEKP